MTSGKAVLSGERTRRFLTSSVTGPADGVASPKPFGGFPLRHLLNLNSVARSGARGVRWT
jgi:hypothetical protein